MSNSAMSNGLELLSPVEMGRADRCAIAAGTSGFVLMRRAGEAVARIVAGHAVDVMTCKILVLCGPGNNGGDGFVAATELSRRGFPVEVALLGEAAALRGDAATARGEWRGGVADALTVGLDGARLIVDALFGAGLSRPIEGETAALIARVNEARQGARVIAVDLPSGINGASGAVMGTAVEADETVTFFRRKPGHLLYPGRSLCGPVHVADIGIPSEALAEIGAASTFANAPGLFLSALPLPATTGHKYDRGHALILSGGLEGSGAARLAARAALRIGAGLVTLAVPSEALIAQAAANTAVMIRRADGVAGFAELLIDRRRNVILVGPAAGVGDDTAAKVLAGLSAGRAAVIDADGLTSFADKPDLLFEAIKGAEGPVVLTPHEGEFARLFHAAADFAVLGSTVARLDKLIRARMAAKASGAVVVLKGPDTVIAAPDGRAAINENGIPFLATAGSGDTLGGFITGLLAQGMPRFEAACAAVWLHGAAGASLGPGLIADDLADALPGVLGRLLRA